MTKIKENLIKSVIEKSFEVGEIVMVEEQYLSTFSKSSNVIKTKILSINGNNIELEVSRYQQVEKVVVDSSNISRFLYDVGANPFIKEYSKARQISYPLESILNSLRLDDNNSLMFADIYTGNDGTIVGFLNWNPYVIGKDGNKIYYQRDFVWCLEDKQLLIDSIYNRIGIGRIVIKKNNYTKVMKIYNSGDKEIGLYDIVDGKQRLNAIQEFVNDKITDSYGNYFSDLSKEAQNEFYNYMGLSYYQLPENCTDEEVLHEFLSVNFTGIQMSKEHIEFVKSIKLK